MCCFYIGKRRFITSNPTKDLRCILKTLMRMSNVGIYGYTVNSVDDKYDVDHVQQSMLKYTDNDYNKILVVCLIVFR
jgi:hypothetical protein